MDRKFNANPTLNGIRINPKSISSMEDNEAKIKYQKKIFRIKAVRILGMTRKLNILLENEI